jgi:hypothetical protein
MFYHNRQGRLSFDTQEGAVSSAIVLVIFVEFGSEKGRLKREIFIRIFQKTWQMLSLEKVFDA